MCFLPEVEHWMAYGPWGLPNVSQTRMPVSEAAVRLGDKLRSREETAQTTS